MNRFFLSLILFVAIADTAFAQKKLEIQGEVSSWVFDDSSGRLFGAVNGGDEVVEYDDNGKEKRRIKVGKLPAEMILKNGKLIVACHGNKSLYVVSLKTNRVAKKISIQGSGPYSIFCSKVKNNYVYAFSSSASDTFNTEIIQVDITRGKILKSMKARSINIHSRSEMRLSDDGKRLLKDVDTSGIYMGNLATMDEKEFKIRTVRKLEEVGGKANRGIGQKYWVGRNCLFTADLKKVHSYKGDHIDLHPDFDLVASLDRRSVYLQRLTNGEVLKDFKLFNNTFSRGRSFSKIPWRFKVLVKFDPKKNRVFVGKSKAAYWIDFQSIVSKLKPNVSIVTKSTQDIGINNTVRVPIKIAGKSSDIGTKLELRNPPTYARLQGNSLILSPGSTDIGQKNFQIRLVEKSSSDILDQVNMKINVHLDGIKFNFQPKGFEVSASGDHAVVWGNSSSSGFTPGIGNSQTSNEFVVVDLKLKKIIKQKSLQDRVLCAAIDRKYVYFSVAGKNQFFRASHRLGGVKKKYLKRSAEIIEKIGPKHLYVKGIFEGHFYKMDPLKEVSLTVLEKELKGQNLDLSRFKRNRFLVNSGVPLLNPIRPKGQYSFSIEKPIVKWGRYLDNGKIHNDAGQELFQAKGGRSSVISPSHPMIVSLGGVSNFGVDKGQFIYVSDLNGGDVVYQTMYQAPVKGGSGSHFYGDAKNRLKTVGNRVLFIVGKRIVIATIPNSTFSKLPKTISFFGKREFVLPASENAKISLKTTGNKNGIEYRVLTENSAFQIDSKTGELTVNTKKLWENNLDGVLAPRWPSSDFEIRKNGRQTGFQFNTIKQRFEQHTGEKLAKDTTVGIARIEVEAENSQGVSCIQGLSLLILVDKNSILDRVKKSQDAVKKKLEEDKKRFAARSRTTSSSQASFERRLKSMEDRIERLEKAINKLLENSKK